MKQFEIPRERKLCLHRMCWSYTPEFRLAHLTVFSGDTNPGTLLQVNQEELQQNQKPCNLRKLYATAVPFIGIRMRARNHHKPAANIRCAFLSLLIKTYSECADIEEEILTTQFTQGRSLEKERTSSDRWQSCHLMFEYTVEKAVGTWVQREFVLEMYGYS